MVAHLLKCSCLCHTTTPTTQLHLHHQGKSLGHVRRFPSQQPVHSFMVVKYLQQTLGKSFSVMCHVGQHDWTTPAAVAWQLQAEAPGNPPNRWLGCRWSGLSSAPCRRSEGVSFSASFQKPEFQKLRFLLSQILLSLAITTVATVILRCISTTHLLSFQMVMPSYIKDFTSFSCTPFIRISAYLDLVVFTVTLPLSMLIFIL